MPQQPTQQAPKRCYVLQLNVGADTFEDLVRQLNCAVEILEESGPGCQSVMGGSYCGHSILVEHDPDMTHDRYFELLDAWLEQERRS